MVRRPESIAISKTSAIGPKPGGCSRTSGENFKTSKTGFRASQVLLVGISTSAVSETLKCCSFIRFVLMETDVRPA